MSLYFAFFLPCFLHFFSFIEISFGKCRWKIIPQIPSLRVCTTSKSHASPLDAPCFCCCFILRFSIRLNGMKASPLAKDSSKGQLEYRRYMFRFCFILVVEVETNVEISFVVTDLRGTLKTATLSRC